jgi:hypothetical protein
MRKRNKLNELCIAVMVAAVSDRFGVPATSDDQQTASGLPLRDDSDPKQITEWTDDIIKRFRWMFESKLELTDEESLTTCALAKAAFEGDEDAGMQLKIMYPA